MKGKIRIWIKIILLEIFILCILPNISLVTGVSMTTPLNQSVIATNNGSYNNSFNNSNETKFLLQMNERLFSLQREEFYYSNGTSKLSAVANSPYFGGYPFSIDYNPYTPVLVGETKTLTTGYLGVNCYYGLSFGVYNGTLRIIITEGDTVLYSGIISGKYFNYFSNMATVPGNSYNYVNFKGNGKPLTITATNLGNTIALIAFNLYSAPINNETARYIMYPPQFAIDISPPITPLNTGMSFILKAPKYTQPTSFAIWIGEGYFGSNEFWWAQIGFNNWWGYLNVSYAGWGIFSNIKSVGTVGGTDHNYPLIPGDYYNFTMVDISGTTWEFMVNGTPIVEGNLTGFINTTTQYANYGAAIGLETITANAGIDNLSVPGIVPVMMEFKINGTWVKENYTQVDAIGENFWNGNATASYAMDLPGWGIESNLQNSSLNNDTLLFGFNYYPLVALPLPSYRVFYNNYVEPINGFSPSSLRLSTYGPELVKPVITTNQITLNSSNVTLAYVVFLGDSNRIIQMIPAIVNGSYTLSVPHNATAIQIYATNQYYNEFQGYYERLYSNVTFEENSLPLGVKWSVTFNGITKTSTSNVITFSEIPIGTYNYSVSTIKGFIPSPVMGTITVNGTNLIKQIMFIAIKYNITFSETGLLQGTTWSVTLNGLTRSSDTPNITFSEPYGIYTFVVRNVSGYIPSFYYGNLTVNGSNVIIHVIFKVALYRVLFIENGLVNGTSWSVKISGEAFNGSLIEKMANSSNSEITLILPNGNYSYLVSSTSQYVNVSGTIKVSGLSIIESVNFTPKLYPIKFIENGLAGNTTWSITLIGKTFEGKATNVTLTSNNSVIVFNEPYGNYSYIIKLPHGYNTTEEKGSIMINGSQIVIKITIQKQIEKNVTTTSETKSATTNNSNNTSSSSVTTSSIENTSTLTTQQKSVQYISSVSSSLLSSIPLLYAIGIATIVTAFVILILVSRKR
ncbi:hypothetical protein V6M85_02905 [Sulfolobus tengchongensis]|uniref:Thermopsin n=1 Tax=Sulfolobus tengchongensis TaxID=207809 RepID=A0AAX4L1L5_9CREN